MLDGKSISLTQLEKDIIEVTVDDVVTLMKNKSKDIIRNVSNDVSLRKSKYGLYLYYKTETHTKPEFISLKQFKEDPETCDIQLLLNHVLRYKKK